MTTQITRTDPGADREWHFDDEIQWLREWGSSTTYDLPPPEPDASTQWIIGSSSRCDLRLADRRGYTSRTHARLERHGNDWALTDLNSKNGLWLNGADGPFFVLTAVDEVRIGSLRLIAESRSSRRVQQLLARLIGWRERRAADVDQALMCIRDHVRRDVPLVVCGEGELWNVARGLHRRIYGDRPFVTSDPRRPATPETWRNAANVPELTEALRAAAGGTLCVSALRSLTSLGIVLDLVAEAREARLMAPTRLMICTESLGPLYGQDVRAIHVTPFRERRMELEQLIREYAAETIEVQGAASASFTEVELNRALAREPATHGDLETAVARLVAIREHGGVTRAAAHLGISHVALSRWLSRRR